MRWERGGALASLVGMNRGRGVDGKYLPSTPWVPGVRSIRHVRPGLAKIAVWLGRYRSREAAPSRPGASDTPASTTTRASPKWS